jgi:hypothetical protein
MASFLSIIKSIGKGIEKVIGVGAGVASTVIADVDPIVTTLNPVAGALLGKIGTVVAGVETIITTAQAGAAKKQTAAQILDAELPELQAIITAFGSKATFDQTAVSNAIDAVTAAYNAIAALEASIKAGTPATDATAVGTAAPGAIQTASS